MTKTNGKKILIVEDELPLLKALSIKLTNEGFTVLQAQNGQIGLDLALKEHPDLILLDIVMPVMDGNTMNDKLRADDWGRTANVIFLTNVTDENKWANFLGGRHYLVKSSWTIEDIVTEVKKQLGIE